MTHDPPDEKVLYEDNPSMFRNRPVSFVITILLCLVVVGLPVLLVWWLKTKATLLRVTEQRTTVRRGLLSKSTTDVWHSDVRNVTIHQTFFQRLFNVGHIGIASAGQGGVEIAVAGIRDPENVKHHIDARRREHEASG